MRAEAGVRPPPRRGASQFAARLGPPRAWKGLASERPRGNIQPGAWPWFEGLGRWAFGNGVAANRTPPPVLQSCRDLGPDQDRGLAPPGLPRAIREIEYLPVNCPSYPSNSVPIIAGCSSDFQTAVAPPQRPPARQSRLRPGFLATL